MTVPLVPTSMSPILESPPLAAEPIVNVAVPPLVRVTDLMTRPSPF